MDAEATPVPGDQPDETADAADAAVEDLEVEAPEAEKVSGAIKWTPGVQRPGT